MATSQFPGTSVTVQTATAGALTGDGTSGNKLSVAVDGSTISVNGSNQLAVDLAGASDGQILYDDGGVVAGNAGFTFRKAANTGLLSMLGAGAGNFDGFLANLNLDSKDNNTVGLVLTNQQAASSLSYVTVTEDGSLYIAADESNTSGVLRWLTAATPPQWQFGADLVKCNGPISIGQTATLGPIAFASLPGSPVAGMMAYISNSATQTWGATITAASPGSPVLGWYNGTNWTVAGK